MKKEICNPNKAARQPMKLFAAAWLLLGVLVCVDIRLETGSLDIGTVGAILCASLAAMAVCLLTGDLFWQNVTLTEQGVFRRILLWKCLIPWSEFREVGIAKGSSRMAAEYRRVLVLVPKTKRKPNDFTVIRLPLRQEILDFVTTHYGELDFDESTDPRGYSIVVD